MEKIYLSRRNLQTLLNKLDRRAAGEQTAATIIKYSNPDDPYVNDIEEVAIVAVEDEAFYANRAPGVMHPSDDPSGRVA